MKRLADQTLYEILEVPPDAPTAEIQAACERAVTLYGPDSLATYTLMSTDEAALLTRRIEEARATLLDPSARARYDARLVRADEARTPAGTNGEAAPAATLPPVIPAVRAPPAPDPEPPRESSPAEGVPGAPALPSAAFVAAAAGEGALAVAGTAETGAPCAVAGEASAEAAAHPAAPAAAAGRPAILLSATIPQAGPPEPPERRPILLEREVREEPASGPVEPAIPPDAPWTGELLRQLREARGVTVQQIADRTRVTRHHIENIEAERFGALPAPVYLRGILVAIARELRLDGQRVARSYLDRVTRAGKPGGPGNPR